MHQNRKRVASVVGLLLVGMFIAVYLSSIDYAQISRLTFSWPMVLVATCVALAFRYWGVYVWTAVLRELGSRSLPNFRAMSNVYAKAWLGRYIPGKVGWLAARIYLAEETGVPRNRLAASAFLEAGMQVVSLVTVSVLLIAFDPRLEAVSVRAKVALIVAAGLCLIAMTPGVFNRLARRVFLVLWRVEPGPELRINGRASVRAFCLYSLGALVSGSSFFLLAKAIDPELPWALGLFCVGAYNLAGAVGIATPVLPSGIGIRDGVLLVLLAIAMPADIAAALVVLGRFWSVLVDLGFYLLCKAGNRRQSVCAN